MEMQMNCPECGSILVMNIDHCEKCNEDVSVYKRTIKASNTFYNSGLAKAKVRDLTGAIMDLTNSLKLDKKNTNARNVLGLVYYEIGEVVDALGQWVLSKHFAPNDNEADGYIKELQSNPTRLEAINQTVKKYNTALSAARQGNDDLAIIQLKKVISMNSHFIKAFHLLALLYIKNGERDKAKKILFKVARIDINNTTTLNYMIELGSPTEPLSEGRSAARTLGTVSEIRPITPISSYKEDKPNILAFVNIILGVVIGVAVVFFLVVPTIRTKISKEYNDKSVAYSDQMAGMTANIATLESDKVTLQDEIVDLKKRIGDMGSVEAEADLSQYDVLFEVIKLYMDGDKAAAAEKMAELGTVKITSAPAKEVYDLIKADTFKEASVDMYNQGHDKYSAGKYDEALVLLEKCLVMDAANTDAMYFMGRSYQRLGDDANAQIYYNKIINDHPDSKRVSEAKSRLKEIT